MHRTAIYNPWPQPLILRFSCSSATRSVYGMQYREKSIAKSLSRMSLEEMDSLKLTSSIRAEAIAAAAAAEEDAPVTLPLMGAVLIAVVLQFLVGYNIGVMVRYRAFELRRR